MRVACCHSDPVCPNCFSSFPIRSITFPIQSPIAECCEQQEHPELWDVSAVPQIPPGTYGHVLMSKGPL